MTPDFTNPYASRKGAWLKGNLHCHTTHSDGSLAPADLARFYAGKKYDFLSITDHHHSTDCAEYEGNGVLALRGVEADFKGRFHTGLIAPPAGAPVYEGAGKDIALQQETIDRNAAAGNLVVLHHPDWEIREHYPVDRMLELQGYHGIEIYNSVIEFLDGSPLSTAKWDRLLAQKHRVFGYANQDLHHPNTFIDCANIVRAADRTTQAVFDALAAGNFYAYCGVTITDVGRDGNRVFVETENADLIRVIGRAGLVLAKAQGPKAEFEFKPGPSWEYMRLECLGHGEAAAYTQPFFRE